MSHNRVTNKSVFRTCVLAITAIISSQSLSASTYYLVATNITGANTKDDIQATNDWYFTVDTGFNLGGGSLVMKDGSSTSYDILMTLYDLTLGGTAVAQLDMTNAQFKSQVDTPTGSGQNNDQNFNAVYYFFGASNYAYNSSCSPCEFGTLGNNVNTDVPFSLVQGHAYDLRLTSNELVNSAYFIKGSTTSSTWSFSTDASCDGSSTSTCTGTYIPAGYVSSVTPVSAVPEPSAVVLLLGGFALLPMLRRYWSAKV